MKIRIKDNSVRIRLSKSEVAQFATDGYVAGKTEFVSGTLKYAIQSSKEESMSADFIDGNITVYVPATTLQEWALSDMVGINYNMPLPNGKCLYLLIEKDFKCMDAPATEDQSDFYENPLKTC